MQYCKKPPLVATLNWRRPRIGARGLWMAVQVEDVHYAFPHRLTLERLFDRHRLDKRGRAAVLGFDDFF